MRVLSCVMASMLSLNVAFAQQGVVTLGTLELASVLVTQPEFVGQLDLTEEQQSELKLMRQRFRGSSVQRVLAKTKAISVAKTSDEKHAEFLGLRSVVDPINEELLAGIDRVLVSRWKSQRFRELFSQALLRFGHYESLLRLWEWDVSKEQFEVIHDQFRRLEAQSTEMYPRLRYEVAAAYLERCGILSAEEIEKATGEWYSVDKLPSCAHDRLILSDLFHPYIVKLVASTLVHLELKLTVNQASECVELNKRLAHEFNTDQALALTEEHPLDFKERLAQWQSQIDAEVATIISEKQLIRLRELLFQKHLSELQFRWAVKAVGKVYGHEDGSSLNSLYAEAWYKMEAMKLKRGIEIMSDVFGERTIRNALGKLVLPENTPWDSNENAVLHAKLRRQSLDSVAPSSQDRNIRRRH